MKIIGHRGARALAPENTLAGLQAALDAGVDGIEFDIQQTADNKLVLSHDQDLHLADTTEWRIRSHPYDDLLARKPDLTTFQAAMLLINRRVPAYIEIKKGTDPKLLIDEVRELLTAGWRVTDFVFVSFDFSSLKQLHHALPDIAIVVNERWSGVRARFRAHRLGTRLIDVGRRSIWSGYVAGMHRSKYRLYTYTINDPMQAERWGKHGLYGVVTDDPSKFQHLRDK